MDVEQRLNRLERQNQRLKKGMLAMVLAGISLLVMGQAAPLKIHRQLATQQLSITTKEGRPVLFIVEVAQV